MLTKERKGGGRERKGDKETAEKYMLFHHITIIGNGLSWHFLVKLAKSTQTPL